MQNSRHSTDREGVKRTIDLDESSTIALKKVKFEVDDDEDQYLNMVQQSMTPLYRAVKVEEYDENIDPIQTSLSHQPTNENQQQISQLENNLKLEKEKVERLQAELEHEKLEKVRRAESDVTCSNCGFVDKEDRINICTSCALKIHNVVVKKGEAIIGEDGFDINRVAICSTCVLDNHAGTDHNIVKFHPVLAATEADKYSSIIMEIRQKMGQMKINMMASSKSILENMENIDGSFQHMFDMVKRSKSSAAGEELVTQIGNQYEKIQTTNGVIEASMEAYATESNANLKYLMDENKEMDENMCRKKNGKEDWELRISNAKV